MIDEVELDPVSLRPLALAVGYAGPDAGRHLLRDLESETTGVHRAYLRRMAPA